MREARELNLTASFQLSPSPEPEKKEIQEIEKVPESGGTPSKDSRRRSSIFRRKKLSMSDEQNSVEASPAKKSRRKTTGSTTPQKRFAA